MTLGHSPVGYFRAPANSGGLVATAGLFASIFGFCSADTHACNNQTHSTGSKYTKKCVCSWCSVQNPGGELIALP